MEPTTAMLLFAAGIAFSLLVDRVTRGRPPKLSLKLAQHQAWLAAHGYRVFRYSADAHGAPDELREAAAALIQSGFIVTNAQYKVLGRTVMVGEPPSDAPRSQAGDEQ